MPLEAIRRANGVLWKPGDRLLLGVSGGGDSMALLHAMAEQAPSDRLSLRVVHVNHRLRGMAADADAAFVARTAKQLGVPCTVVRTNVRARAVRSGLSVEMAAREARLEAFAKLSRRFKASGVVLAHTRDDQAEGLLLRLVRGTGREGLSGMAADDRVGDVRLLRPLLDVSHEDCLTFLRERRATWCEDATNRDDAMLRNRVRHELLPLLEQRFNPAIRQVLVRTASILADDETVLRELVDKAYARIVGTRGLSVRAHRLRPAIRTRVLIRWLRDDLDVAPERIDQALLHQVAALLAGRTTSVNLPGGSHLVRTGTVLERERKRPDRVSSRTSLNLPGRTAIPKLAIEVRVTRSKGWKPDPSARVGALPAVGYLTRTIESMVVRNRRPGDRIAPVGMTGSTTLQDLLINAKVSREDRAAIPVFDVAGEVAWLPGYRVSRRFAVPRRTDPSWRIEVRALRSDAP